MFAPHVVGALYERSVHEITAGGTQNHINGGNGKTRGNGKSVSLIGCLHLVRLDADDAANR